VLKRSGSDAAAHDRHAGVPGAFEQGRAGEANWRALGGSCRVLAGPFLDRWGARLEV
jgi:hypothetical protein